MSLIDRPTKLDWLIYRLFVNVWDPIFCKKPWLIYGIKKAIDEWIFDFENFVVDKNNNMTYDEWLKSK